MKKAFELFLVFIIFYGVYTAFDNAAPLLFANPQAFWVVIVSLLAATLLLVLYTWIISSTAKRKLKETVSHLKKEIDAKDEEIKIASSFKNAVIKEAEETIDTEIVD
jgi:predicted membrane protein